MKDKGNQIFIDDYLVRLKTSSQNNDKYAVTLSVIHDYYKNERLMANTIIKNKLLEPNMFKILLTCFTSKVPGVLKNLYSLISDLITDSPYLLPQLVAKDCHISVAKTFVNAEDADLKCACLKFMAPLILVHPEFAKIARSPELAIKRKDGTTLSDTLKIDFSNLIHQDNKH